MGDRLTQMQDCIDDLLIQMFAGINYNRHHHPYADIPNQPSQAPPTVSFNDPDPPANTLTNGDATSQSQFQSQKKADDEKDDTKKPTDDDDDPDGPPAHDKPHSREEHTQSLRELAQGLVLKEQQIEILIGGLPGIGSSERDQDRRIKELQEELKALEHERREKEVVRERLVEELGGWLVGGRRVP